MTDVATTCKYCGYKDHYLFIPSNELERFAEVLEYDIEYLCGQCGASVRVNEAVDEVILREYGFIE